MEGWKIDTSGFTLNRKRLEKAGRMNRQSTNLEKKESNEPLYEALVSTVQKWDRKFKKKLKFKIRKKTVIEG